VVFLSPEAQKPEQNVYKSTTNFCQGFFQLLSTIYAAITLCGNSDSTMNETTKNVGVSSSSCIDAYVRMISELWIGKNLRIGYGVIWDSVPKFSRGMEENHKYQVIVSGPRFERSSTRLCRYILDCNVTLILPCLGIQEIRVSRNVPYHVPVTSINFPFTLYYCCFKYCRIFMCVISSVFSIMFHIHTEWATKLLLWTEYPY
jgi:hypothetical protein